MQELLNKKITCYCLKIQMQVSETGFLVRTTEVNTNYALVDRY